MKPTTEKSNFDDTVAIKNLVDSAASALVAEVNVYSAAGRTMTLFDKIRLAKSRNVSDTDKEFIKATKGQLKALAIKPTAEILAVVPSATLEPIITKVVPRHQMQKEEMQKALALNPFPSLTLYGNAEVRLPSLAQVEAMTVNPNTGKFRRVQVLLPCGPANVRRSNALFGQEVSLNTPYVRALRDTITIAAMRTPRTGPIVDSLVREYNASIKQAQERYFGTKVADINYKGQQVSAAFARIIKGYGVRQASDELRYPHVLPGDIAEEAVKYYKSSLNKKTFAAPDKTGVWFNADNAFSLNARYSSNGQKHREELAAIFSKVPNHGSLDDPKNPLFIPTKDYQVELFTAVRQSSSGLFFRNQTHETVMELELMMTNMLLNDCAEVVRGNTEYMDFVNSWKPVNLFNYFLKPEEYEHEKAVRGICGPDYFASWPFLALMRQAKRRAAKEVIERSFSLAGFSKEKGRLNKLLAEIMARREPFSCLHYSDNVYILIRALVTDAANESDGVVVDMSSKSSVNKELRWLWFSFDASSFEAHHMIEDFCIGSYKACQWLLHPTQKEAMQQYHQALIRAFRSSTDTFGMPNGKLFRMNVQPLPTTFKQHLDKALDREKQVRTGKALPVEKEDDRDELTEERKSKLQEDEKRDEAAASRRKLMSRIAEAYNGASHLSDGWFGYFAFFLPQWLANASMLIGNQQLKVVGMPTGIGPTFFFNDQVSAIDSYELANFLALHVVTVKTVDGEMVEAIPVASPGREQAVARMKAKGWSDSRPETNRILSLAPEMLVDGYKDTDLSLNQAFRAMDGTSFRCPTGAVWKLTAVTGNHLNLASLISGDPLTVPVQATFDFLGHDLLFKSFSARRSYMFPVLTEARRRGMILWNKIEARGDILHDHLKRLAPDADPAGVVKLASSILRVIIGKTYYAYGAWLDEAKTEALNTYLAGQLMDVIEQQGVIFNSSVSVSNFIKGFMKMISQDDDFYDDILEDSEERTLPTVEWLLRLWLSKDDYLEACEELGIANKALPDKDHGLEEGDVELVEDEFKDDERKTAPVPEKVVTSAVVPNLEPPLAHTLAITAGKKVKGERRPVKAGTSAVRPSLSDTDKDLIISKVASKEPLYILPRYKEGIVMVPKTVSDLVYALLFDLNVCLRGLDQDDYDELKQSLRGPVMERLERCHGGNPKAAAVWWRYNPKKVEKGQVKLAVENSRAASVRSVFSKLRLVTSLPNVQPVLLSFGVKKNDNAQDTTPTAHELARSSQVKDRSETWTSKSTVAKHLQEKKKEEKRKALIEEKEQQQETQEVLEKVVKLSLSDQITAAQLEVKEAEASIESLMALDQFEHKDHTAETLKLWISTPNKLSKAEKVALMVDLSRLNKRLKTLLGHDKKRVDIKFEKVNRDEHSFKDEQNRRRNEHQVHKVSAKQQSLRLAEARAKKTRVLPDS